MMYRLVSKTLAHINILSLDEGNVIKKNPAVSYAAEQGSHVDMQHNLDIKEGF